MRIKVIYETVGIDVELGGGVIVGVWCVRREAKEEAAEAEEGGGDRAGEDDRGDRAGEDEPVDSRAGEDEPESVGLEVSDIVARDDFWKTLVNKLDMQKEETHIGSQGPLTICSKSMDMSQNQGCVCVFVRWVELGINLFIICLQCLSAQNAISRRCSYRQAQPSTSRLLLLIVSSLYQTPPTAAPSGPLLPRPSPAFRTERTSSWRMRNWTTCARSAREMAGQCHSCATATQTLSWPKKLVILSPTYTLPNLSQGRVDRCQAQCSQTNRS